MQFDKAGKHILTQLSDELPAGLYYHNLAHTLDVYAAAEHLAAKESIAGHERLLLLTAAWYHDSGYLAGKPEHEQESCKIVREKLPEFGYSAADIEQICTIIMATRLPQTPVNLAGQVLADADLDYLGRDDFFAISEKLYWELKFKGQVESETEWNLLQVKFLESHQYFTESARASRQAKKEHNLQLIKAELK